MTNKHIPGWQETHPISVPTPKQHYTASLEAETHMLREKMLQYEQALKAIATGHDCPKETLILIAQDVLPKKNNSL